MVLKLLARIFSLISSWPIFLLFVAAIYYFEYVTQTQTLIIVVSFVISVIITLILRLIFKGERENKKSLESAFLKKFGSKNRGAVTKLIETLESRKFASSHVARIIILGYVLFISLNRFDILIAFIVLIVIVGTSRVILKRHNYIDVFFGILIGLVSTYLTYTFIFV